MKISVFTFISTQGDDWVLRKRFANREKDWLDMDTVVSRQWGKLNLGLVRSELAPLLELMGEPENMDRLEKMIAHHTLKLPEP